MSPMVAGSRQVRAVAVIVVAVLMLVAVSIQYLRPPAPVVHPVPAPVVVSETQVLPAQHLNFTGRTDGGYFVWHIPGSGSGGHG